MIYEETFASGLCEIVISGVRQQGDVPGALDCERKLALVPRACAGLAARLYLSALRNETAQLVWLLVVDVIDLVDAERADLATATTATATASAPTAKRGPIFPAALGRAGRAPLEC